MIATAMAQDRLRKISDYHVARYGDRVGVPLNKSARIRADLFRRWVRTGKRLLDVGSGSGQLLEHYAAGNRVTAMDADRPAVETLEHAPYPSIFLEEVRRVLVPGGLFVGSVPNAYRYRARIEVLFGRPLDRDHTHLQFFSLASLRATLERHFVVDEIVPVRGRWAHRWPSLFAHKLAWLSHRWD